MLLIGPPILRQCILSPPSPPPPCPPPKNPSFLNPCAHFFFALNPETVPENLTKLLEESWNYDPLTTLKLIAYLRTFNGVNNGVNGVKGFYLSALWLHKTHPLTLSCNLREFSGFGSLSLSSLRDFAEILRKLVETENCDLTDDTEIARRAVRRYVHDSNYRFFHDRVSDLFADLLRSDLVSLKSGNVDFLSFASVDCPSIDSAIDRNTLLCESIARKIFPKDSDLDYDGIQDEYYVYRVRNRLRKDVLVPLRTALQEKPRGESRDYTLEFMKKAYQKLMKTKEKENRSKKSSYYQIVLSMILKGNARVFPSTPLSVISSLTVENKEEKELEWSDMVNSFSKSGKLRNSVVICDVSYEMSENSRNVSASMGLLISELSDGPWKETVYGFNRSPKLQKIQGSNDNDLFSKLNFIKQLICTDRVDIEAILNQILQLGITTKVSPEQMVKRVFVFTNKEFRNCLNHSWGWNYRAVWENYKKSGYDRVPEVVFWNVEGKNYRPPAARDVFGTRLMIVDGFSRSLFAFVLNEDAVWRSDEIKSVSAAEDVMNITISGKKYQNFAVLD